MGRRITRKQLKQDEFVSAVDSFFNWFSMNWRPVAAAFGGAAAVALLWWGVSSWTGGRAEEASNLLHAAVSSFEGAPGEAVDAPKTPEDAEPQFEEVVDRFGGTNQADVARLYLARIWMNRGETDQARDTLVELARRHEGDALGQLATLNLVSLRVASGQGEQVASELGAIVAGASQDLPRDIALFELAKLYENEKNLELAREHFQKVVDEFPESPLRFVASQRLRELG